MKYLMMLILIASVTFGQTMKVTEYRHGNDIELYCLATSIDSGTTTSDIFKLNEYDGSIVAYDMGYLLNIDTLTANDEIIAVTIEGAMSNGGWTSVETVLAADTLNANHADFTDVAGVVDLDIGTYVFPRYRVKVASTGASSNPCTVTLSLYAYKRD